jgi:molybdopterin molybdotransferase
MVLCAPGGIEERFMGRKTSSHEVSIRDTWDRIESWLGKYAGYLADSLAEGASADRLRSLEASMGASLPLQFKESMAVHDGQTEDYDFIPDDDIGAFYLLQSKEIPRRWKQWNSLLNLGEFDNTKATPDKGVAGAWWNAGWIPFASNGGSDYLCIDLAPARGGAVGQVIRVRHDDPAREIMASSYGEWLQGLARTLEAGGIDYLMK